MGPLRAPNEFRCGPLGLSWSDSIKLKTPLGSTATGPIGAHTDRQVWMAPVQVSKTDSVSFQNKGAFVVKLNLNYCELVFN